MSLGNNPAYPCNRDRPDLGQDAVESFLGMTIRQRYAMAAMQGLMSDAKHGNSFVASSKDWEGTKEKIVWTSFQLADAMIAFEEQEHAEKAKQGMGDKAT